MGLLETKEVEMTYDERMGYLWTVRKFAAWKYGTDEPTRANVKTVNDMCREGKLPARKVGKEWRINVRMILEEFDD